MSILPTVTFRHYLDHPRMMSFKRYLYGQPHVQVREEMADPRLWDSALQDPSEVFALPGYVRDPDNLPDMVLATGETLGQMAHAGMLVPLDEFMDAPDGLPRDDFHPWLLNALTYGGEVVGLPIEANPYAMFCNLDRFAEAGLDLPKTWADTRDAAEACTLDLDGDGVPEVYGYTQCTFQVVLLVWQAGGDILSEDGRTVLFGSDEAAEALSYHRSLRVFSPPHVNFERNDVAMKLSIADYLADGRYVPINYDIVPLPRGKVAANSYGQSQSVVALGVCRTERRNEQNAWKLLRWWMSDGQLDWCRCMGYVPVRRSFLERPQWKAQVEAEPRLKPFVEQLGICRYRPCSPVYRAVKWAFTQTVHDTGEGRGLCPVDKCREIADRHARKAQEAVDRYYEEQQVTSRR
jgi:ABC-type glycerol-3-phosphate transport system substrate-binding protein